MVYLTILHVLEVMDDPICRLTASKSKSESRPLATKLKRVNRLTA